jgi:hypothetical protein
MLSEYSIKYPHLVNLSTITSILSCSYPITRSFDFNSLTIKSHDITFYGYVANLTSYSFLCGLYLFILFLWQSKYFLMTYLASL